MYIFSKKNKARLIACIYKVKKTMPNRIDLSPSNELLQAGIIKLKDDFILKKHLHTQILRKTKGTQEIWIVMSGKIKVTFYDTDKTKISEKTLNKGDMSILFRGGHSLKCLKKESIIYEIKNGPYKKNKDLIRF
tara:strand:- start:48 stop:449 length:402 start_codon:yes stop_codon:yes gene_type:complete